VLAALRRLAVHLDTGTATREEIRQAVGVEPVPEAVPNRDLRDLREPAEIPSCWLRHEISVARRYADRVARPERLRSVLIFGAKVAGAVAVVVLIVIFRPFLKSEQPAPSSDSNLKPYVSGFRSPTDVAVAPGEPERLYVVEQAGTIRYVEHGHIAGTFLDISDHVGSGGERGLLSIAFSPEYERNHVFYVNYTDRNGDTHVAQLRSRNGRGLVSSERDLLFVKQPYPNHNGGQLQFGPGGLLYVGMGDGGSAGDPENRAQNLRERLGKLLRIDPSRPNARWEVVGYGLRNPWRFSFDRANGDLYLADVGQGEWEEIDYRPRARLGKLANYGWRLFEGRARFAAGTLSGRGELLAPISVYGHAHGRCSVTGGYVYRGSKDPAAVGRYFFGDWCSGEIWSLRVERGRAVDLRKEQARIGQLSSFGEAADGALYAVSGGGARLYRLVG
jgi:glucose/arabinose dehydrogenase